MTKLLTTLPFCGFYESAASGMIDSEVESFCEYNETDNLKEEHPDLNFNGDIGDLVFDAMDYPKAYRAYAESYAANLAAAIADETGLDLGLEFESMDSPREYNFKTDRLYAHIEPDKVQAMFEQTNQGALAARIKERFTSCDGFISFYSNDVTVWLEKPLDQWDPNELGTLLEAFLSQHAGDLHKFELNLHYDNYEDAQHAFDAGMDWPKYEAALADLIAEKQNEKLADDPNYIPPAPRCPYTLDLFARTVAP